MGVRGEREANVGHACVRKRERERIHAHARARICNSAWTSNGTDLCCASNWLGFAIFVHSP